MKIAEELKRLSKRHPMTNYYDALLKDLKNEASEGGYYKILTFAKDNYNAIAKKLLHDGFEVVINNYDESHEFHVTYVVWDKERFNEYLKESTDIDKSTLHHGLI